MFLAISIKTILQEWQSSPSQIAAIELLDKQLAETGAMGENKLWAKLWQRAEPEPLLQLRAEIPANWEALFSVLEAKKLDFAALDENLAQHQPVLLKIIEPGRQWTWVLCYGKSSNQSYACVNNGVNLIYTRESLRAKWTTNGPGSGLSKTLG